ncbi:MAG: hypothetical protein ABJH07_16885 [Sedimentitalea sp.]|uniref:hypothetical protein n=1 Tax=Sedimentitalea sp. TaxID=2048915 RepID=UPI003265687B
MLLPPVRMVCCSAFGSAFERAGAEASVPVMKPNEAMFDAAFSHGHRIAMIYTFPPVVAGLEQEFSEAAKARRSTAKIVSVFCDGALVAKRAEDGATHGQLTADCVAGIKGADVILLAQFSMASAADAARERTTIPVLTSPQAAITQMLRRIERGGKDDPC